VTAVKVLTRVNFTTDNIPKGGYIIYDFTLTFDLELLSALTGDFGGSSRDAYCCLDCTILMRVCNIV